MFFLIRIFLIFVVLLIASATAANAAVNNSSSDTLPDGTLSRKLGSGGSNQIGTRFNLIVPSMVLHGFQPDPEIVKAMPRRIDSSADFVATPGIGLEYHGDDHFLLLGVLVKDCFDNLAGTLQLGKRFGIEKDSAWAISFGVFVRQTPYVCTKYGCSDLGGDSLIFNATINRQSIDIIPLPFLHYSRTLFRSHDFQMNIKVMANFIFNEVGVEVPL